MIKVMIKGHDQGHDHDQGHGQGHDHDQGRGVPVSNPDRGPGSGPETGTPRP